MSEEQAEIFCSWNFLQQACDMLVQRIQQSGWYPTAVIGLARGGLIPACLLAHKLGVQHLYSIGATSYEEQTKGQVKFYQNVTSLEVANQHVLIVDDLVDTGDTMQQTRIDVFANRPTSVRTAVLYVKDNSVFSPDYYAYSVTNNAWVVFPWEVSAPAVCASCGA